MPPESRGQGIGSKLVQHAQQFAAEMGHDEIYLWFPERKTAALRVLYERLGWQLIEQTQYLGELALVGSFKCERSV